MLAEITAIKILANEIRGHGSPYDRGGADSYYDRARYPHKMVHNTRILIPEGTPEYEEYMRGYDDNEALGAHKDWGDL